jgi:hypothetical protein
MAQYHGGLDPLESRAGVIGVQVAAADAAARNFNQDLIRAGFGLRNLLKSGFTWVFTEFDKCFQGCFSPFRKLRIDNPKAS